MPYRIRFSAKQKVDIETFDLPPLTPQAVRVRSICSLMSTGTENTVLNQSYAPGTHWDRWVSFPFYPGYAIIGQVEELGSDVRDLSVGQRVAARVSHQSQFLERADKLYPIPQGVSPEQAAWFAIGKITAAGAMRAEYRIGDQVLVLGAGPIGQLSLRWALAMGAESVVVIDPMEQRLELARRGGATATLAQPLPQATDAVIAACHGKRPRIVIDSTGSPAVFSTALAIADNNGKVLLLGDTGQPSDQRLTGDVLTRGVTIVGAHDDSPWPDRQRMDIYRLFFRMVISGRIRLDGLNTHTFPGLLAADAYHLANTQRGQTLGILFDWSSQS